MRFHISGAGEFHFNLANAVKELQDYLEEFVRIGGVKWLGATVEAIPIPTWSGASRATFEKLARDLGTSVPIGPIRSITDRTSLGRATSAGSGFFKEGPRVYFIYKSTLEYLHYNEFNNAIAGPPPQPFSNNVRYTPYGFLAKGDEALVRYLDTVKLPNPLKHVW